MGWFRITSVQVRVGDPAFEARRKELAEFARKSLNHALNNQAAIMEKERWQQPDAQQETDAPKGSAAK